MQKPKRSQEHCKPERELQYKGGKAVRSTASRRRDCSVEAQEKPGALQAGVGIAVQKPKRSQEYCKPEPEEQCRSQKEAPALQEVAAMALRPPEIKPAYGCITCPGFELLRPGDQETY